MVRVSGLGHGEDERRGNQSEEEYFVTVDSCEYSAMKMFTDKGLQNAPIFGGASPVSEEVDISTHYIVPSSVNDHDQSVEVHSLVPTLA